MSWDLQSDRPIYTQIIEQMELKISTGVYPPGTKLPSVRDLAQEASVNPNTMQRALAKLEENGLVYTNRTSGRFVTEDTEMIKQIRKRLVENHVNDFLTRMNQLGFENEDILSIITKLMEERKHE